MAQPKRRKVDAQSILNQMKTLDLLINRSYSSETNFYEFEKGGPKQYKWFPSKVKSLYLGFDQFNEIDYTGQTYSQDPFKRPQQHFKDPNKRVVKIKQLFLPDWVDLDLAEMHLIMKLKPRANKIYKGGIPMSSSMYLRILKRYEHYYNLNQTK